MRVMMTLGEPRRKSPAKAVVGMSLVLGLAAGGVYWYRHRDTMQLPTFGQKEVVPAAAPLVQPVVDTAPPPPPTPAALRRQAGLQLAAFELSGPLETHFIDAVGPVGAALSQVATRSLVWWVQVPNEILRGDKLEVLFEERANEEPLVHAIRFQSQKTGQTHTAYRFHAEGQPHARYYLPDGNELELRLDPAPLDDYEQITSLLRDGRRHQGVDFRTPVGTPVKAPFDAVVVRKNWNTRANGNCLELQEVGGSRKVLMLHLDVFPRELRPGQRVKKGELVAHSGNSGRSFAPHLHYQLMRRDGRVLDPFESFRTYRRQLPSAALPHLANEVARMDALMSK